MYTNSVTMLQKLPKTLELKKNALVKLKQETNNVGYQRRFMKKKKKKDLLMHELNAMG